MCLVGVSELSNSFYGSSLFVNKIVLRHLKLSQRQSSVSLIMPFGISTLTFGSIACLPQVSVAGCVGFSIICSDISILV
jgi:D-alanyl-lipoteichoic acid acyltransferase DltB (MBOAT superfamily)